MKNIRFVLLVFCVFFSVVLWADISTPQSHCNSISHIKGFSKIPKTKFYFIETTGPFKGFVFHRIKSDTLDVRYISLYYNPYISWDPKLSNMEQGKQYRTPDTGIVLYLDENQKKSDASKVKSMTVDSPRFQEFDRIDSYFVIVPDAGKKSKYNLKLYKRIYTNRDFTIYETGEFNKFTAYLVKSQTDYSIPRVKEDIPALLKYAKSLKNHEVIFNHK